MRYKLHFDMQTEVFQAFIAPEFLAFIYLSNLHVTQLPVTLGDLGSGYLKNPFSHRTLPILYGP